MCNLNTYSKMNKRILTTVTLCVLALAAQAQTVVTAAGGTAGSATHAFTYSVGQVATAATADGQLREGVVQPLTVEPVGIANADATTLTVYPNPTMDGVNLRRDEAAGTVVRLYSLEGRLLRSEQWDGTALRLDLSALAAGVYMLQADGRTFKITKQ